MPAADLMELLTRLHGEAVKVLVESGSEAQSSREDADTDRRFQLGYEACNKLLADLDSREERPDRPGRLASRRSRSSCPLVFTNRSGNVLEYGNLLRRHLKPIVEEVNAPWAGLHTFRHTFASLHLSEGTNILQLSRALGHHSAAFTLSRYTHLLPGDEAPALDLTPTDDLRFTSGGRGVSCSSRVGMDAGRRAAHKQVAFIT
jgi:hypothetical protein